MEVAIQNSKDDFIKFFRLHFFKRFQTIPFLLLGLFLLICIYNTSIGLSKRYLLWQVILIDICLIGIIILLLYFIPLFRFKAALNNKTSNGFPLFEKKVVRLNEIGVIIESESKRATLEWKQIKSVLKTKNLIAFQIVDKTWEILPTKFFGSENEIKLFYQFILKRINRK